MTWTNLDGTRCVFSDGIKIECFAGYATGETVEGNGNFILGQEQDSFGTPAFLS